MENQTDESAGNGANPPASGLPYEEVNPSAARVVNPVGQSVNTDASVVVQNDPGVNAGEVERFIREVFGETQGHLEVTSFLNGKRQPVPMFRRLGETITRDSTGEPYTVTPLTLADGIAEADRERMDPELEDGRAPVNAWYIRMTTLAAEPVGFKRGGKANTREFVGFWLDGDYDVPGHHEAEERANPLPPDADTVLGIWTACGFPEPSVMWNSGGGINGLWLLEKPVVFTDDADGRALITRAQKASERWHSRAHRTAAQMGWHHDTTANLDRLMRLPGSVNRKDWTHPKPVTTEYTGQKYSLADLIALIPEPVEAQDGSLVDPRTGEVVAPPKPVRVPSARSAPGGGGDGLTPWEDFDRRGDWWGDVLAPVGFSHYGWAGGTEGLYRPGKNEGQQSATLNHDGTDKLFIFSSTVLSTHRSAEDYTGKYLTKSQVWCHMVHGGDWKACAADLRGRGYGSEFNGVAIPGARTPQDMWPGQLNEDGTAIEGTQLAEAVAEAAAPMADWSGLLAADSIPSAPRQRSQVTGPAQSKINALETREAFAERMERIDDAGVRKNEARRRVKQLAAKGTTEEERQDERDFLKQLTKLSLGDFKALYAAAVRSSAQEAATGSDDRPVYAMGDEHKEYTGLVELIENQAFPETYVRDGKLVHVEPVSGVRTAKNKNSTASYQAKDITPAALRRLVATYTTPLRVTEKGADSPLPTRALCESVLDNPEWDGVNTLNGLTDAPFVRANGSICQEHGYDRTTGMWLALPSGYEPVPDNPSPDDVRNALDLLMNKVLRDFPFASTADRANSIGMLVTPMIRNIVDCAVPLHVISAHTPGTGKTLLAKIAIAIHGGSAYQFPRNSDEELRKQVTSILMDQASPVVNFDNLATGSTIESAALASLITSDVWKDRVLGGNTTVALPNDKMWIATGNNLKVNTDFAQRTVMVQLDAGTEQPELRPAASFCLGDLEQWLLKSENRAQLVRALLVLIRDWAAAGMPKTDEAMRSFTPWAQAIGGLLAHHGITDFNGNRDAVHEADEDKQQDALFLQKWIELIGDEWISASDLITKYQIMEQARYTSYHGVGIDSWQGAFPVRSNGKPYSAVGLGKWLGARKDTPTHGFALRRRTDPETNRAEWRVERASQGASPGPEQTEAFQPDLS